MTVEHEISGNRRPTPINVEALEREAHVHLQALNHIDPASGTYAPSSYEGALIDLATFGHGDDVNEAAELLRNRVQAIYDHKLATDDDIKILHQHFILAGELGNDAYFDQAQRSLNDLTASLNENPYDHVSLLVTLAVSSGDEDLLRRAFIAIASSGCKAGKQQKLFQALAQADGQDEAAKLAIHLSARHQSSVEAINSLLGTDDPLRSDKIWQPARPEYISEAIDRLREFNDAKFNDPATTEDERELYLRAVHSLWRQTGDDTFMHRFMYYMDATKPRTKSALLARTADILIEVDDIPGEITKQHVELIKSDDNEPGFDGTDIAFSEFAEAYTRIGDFDAARVFAKKISDGKLVVDMFALMIRAGYVADLDEMLHAMRVTGKGPHVETRMVQAAAHLMRRNQLAAALAVREHLQNPAHKINLLRNVVAIVEGRRVLPPQIYLSTPAQGAA